jgi:hypothetical protein
LLKGLFHFRVANGPGSDSRMNLSAEAAAVMPVAFKFYFRADRREDSDNHFDPLA